MHRLALDADPASRSNGRFPRAASEIARLNAEVARLQALCRRQATALERLPNPPVTRDQLTMLEAGDNVVSNDEAVETFKLPLVTLDDQLRRAA